MQSCSDHEWQRSEYGCIFSGVLVVEARCASVCFSARGPLYGADSRSRAEWPLFGPSEFRMELLLHSRFRGILHPLRTGFHFTAAA